MNARTKVWYKSRTKWLHIISFISTTGPMVIVMLGGLDLPAKDLAIWTFIVNTVTNAAGYYLRNVTNTQIGKPSDPMADIQDAR